VIDNRKTQQRSSWLGRQAHHLDIDPALSDTVVQTLVRTPHQSGAPQHSAKNAVALSQREVEFLRLVAHGFANKEIAARLQLSIKTVETYKARSMEKLGMDSRVDIVRYAVAQGWFQDAG